MLGEVMARELAEAGGRSSALDLGRVRWISLRDARKQLHRMAEHCEALAKAEEREARKVAPLQRPKPKAESGSDALLESNEH